MVPLVPTLTKELHAFAILHQVIIGWGFPGGSDSKESACSVGDLGLIPGCGRSHGERNDYPLQYSCLENSMDSGTWQATWGCKETDTPE